MSTVAANPTQGLALMAGTQSFLAHDDDGDRKTLLGAYSHTPLCGSATEAEMLCDALRAAGLLLMAGGAGLKVRNETGGNLGPGPVRVSGYSAAQGRFLIIKADADGQLPAQLLLLAQLADTTNGEAYLGGDFAYNTNGRAVGDICYLDATAGGVVFVAPTGPDQIVQEIGQVKVAHTSGTIAGLVRPPIKLGTSWLQTGVPRWVKVSAVYSDFTDAGNTKSVAKYSLPAGGVIHAVKVKHSASFTGGSISAYTLSIGISGTETKYTAAFDVLQAPGNTVFQHKSNLDGENHAAAVDILATATSTDDTLNHATAGAVEIWLLVSQAL